MKSILFLDEITRRDIKKVGGKGANLGEMKHSKLPVPNAFCITTRMYDEFIINNNLGKYITDRINNVTIKSLDKVGNSIREKIKEGKITKELEIEIKRALNKFPQNTYFSIRSSATVEDSQYTSFAGQQDTYLNVQGLENIKESIIECWASLYTDRSILYRRQHNIKDKDISMAVVIQQMVKSEYSGIMFTADMVTGNRNTISIDAGFGLGEALVSGIITPDSYKVNKESLEIIEEYISDKKYAIIPKEEGGVENTLLEGNISKKRVLTDFYIEKLARLALKIEKLYKTPQDIEWCIEKNQIYIVQSRPITSLFPIPNQISHKKGTKMYLSFSHIQMTTNTMSPLGQDIMRLLMRIDEVSIEDYKPKFLVSAGGRLYLDISSILNYRLFRKIVPEVLRNVDENIGESLKQVLDKKEFRKSIIKDMSIRKSVKTYYKIPIKTYKNFKFKDSSNNVEEVTKLIEDKIQKINKLYEFEGSNKEKLEFIYTNTVFMKNALNEIFTEILPGIVAMKKLSSIEQDLFGNDSYTSDIFKGIEGNITTNLGLLIGDLGDIAREDEEIIDILNNKDYQSLIKRVNENQNIDEFKNLFNIFMKKYGSRVAGEIDIKVPRWNDNPESVAKYIMLMVDTRERKSHRDEFEKVVQNSKNAEKEFIEEATKQYGKRTGNKVAKLTKIFRECMPLREHPKYLLIHYLSNNRKLLMEIAEDLVKQKRLENKEDIFYLGFFELYKFVQNKEDMMTLITKRKEEYSYYEKMTPPKLMTNYGEIINFIENREYIPKNALCGTPVSSGVVEGIARVVTNPIGIKIKKGEILVAPFTDPGWTILFVNASALVMEIGGLLTHGTVVAREYGLPAVVGVENATKIIRDGQMIRVNGNNGYVELL